MLRVMARTLGLPVTDLDAAEVAPRVDRMRAQLGGRAASNDRVGELVQLRTSDLVSLPGVLLAEDRGSALVLLRGNVVRKAPMDFVEAPVGPPATYDPELIALSTDARRFAALSEGQPVQIRDASLDALDGILVEKCRFGGLVLKSDESLVAVGFSKLSPRAPKPELECSSKQPAQQGEQAD